MPSAHQVLIVGAGVAGSTIAIRLAEAGLRVLIIDRSEFPRRKVCGEGIFPKGVEELSRLCVLDELEEQSARIDRLRFQLEVNAAEAPISPAGRPALGVERSLLDAALLRRAERAGAEVRMGVVARGLEVDEGGDVSAIETSEGRVPARCFVAADGHRSMLRTQAGLDRRMGRLRYGVSAHIAAPTMGNNKIQVEFRPGYELYLTPVGLNLANAALLCDERTARSFHGGLEGQFRTVLADVFQSRDLTLADEPRMAGPFPAASTRAWNRNLVLAGDAAGFYDGISGEGISLALRSAPLAAAAVQTFLETNSDEPLREYEKAVSRLRAPSTMFARLILALASRPALGKRILRNLAGRPKTFSRLVAVNSGELRFRDLRLQDLLAVAIGKG